MRKALPPVLALALALAARTEDAPAGPHGGAWLQNAEGSPRLEVVHDAAKKRATVYTLANDGQTPAPVADAPELTLPQLDEKAALRGKALELKDGAASAFEFAAEPARAAPKDPPPNSGPHGGLWLDVGAHTALIEYLYEPKPGRAVIWLLDKDGQTPFKVKDAPVFNVDSLEGPVQLTGKALDLREGSATAFEFEGAGMEQIPPGLASRFTLMIGGKQYQAPLTNRDHGHQHGPGK